MDDITTRIRQNKADGYNCTQNVLLLLSDRIDVPKEVLLAAAAPFGFGLGNGKGTCGALVGAAIALGIKKFEGKKLTGKELHEAFIKRCGSSICGELKGIGNGKIMCSCEECIQAAYELAEERI